MKRCRLDKIASVTRRLELRPHVLLGERIPAVAGTVVACRVASAKTSYDTLEDVHGRMVRLVPGDVIAGALGHRDALHGFSGEVPSAVSAGDELHLLNLGGVIGRATGGAPAVGEPFRLEVLGAVQSFPRSGERAGQPANIADAALSAPASVPAELPPVVTLVGTSMNSGKTTAACALVSTLAARGLRVAAGKLTGVSLRRDVLEMADSGAAEVALFTDFGVVTTDEASAVPAAKRLLAHLADGAPDAIVLELGDGLLGTYGVHALLADAELSTALTNPVLCACDPVGAWGGVQLLAQRYGLRPGLVTGPLTNSPAGVRACEQGLGIPTWNALDRSQPFPAATLGLAASDAYTHNVTGVAV